MTTTDALTRDFGSIASLAQQKAMQAIHQHLPLEARRWTEVAQVAAAAQRGEVQGLGALTVDQRGVLDDVIHYFVLSGYGGRDGDDSLEAEEVRQTVRDIRAVLGNL